VTGITLSREQLAWAREAAGPAPIELRLQDYRAVVGRFERIVSIEMIEAVGAAYWPAYFAMLGRSLAPGGRIVLQAITIREDRFESYRRRPDFIQTCIFPGGMLPTATIIAAQAQAAGLRVVECETFGAGYADTLAAWRERFEASLDAVRALGLPERFIRMWRYYLCYCEAGFRDGVIDVGLYVMEAGR
ncbi:class I SAM-dependent methyltransferase, partial [Endobacter medicaginis]